MNTLDKFFKMTARGTNLRTELLAGATTFFAMSYIMIVNPVILSSAGMDPEAVYVATILASVAGTLFMAFIANVPYALAPGMGMNSFFASTLCLGMGFTWQESLAMVFICGLIGVAITTTKLRKELIISIPQFMQNGIGGALGFFITYIGLKSAGFLSFIVPPGSYSLFPDGTIITDSSPVPALVNFTQKGALLALIGLFVMVFLVVRGVKGAVLLGVLITTALGVPMGIVTLPASLFGAGHLSSLRKTAFAAFSDEGIIRLFSGRHSFGMITVAMLTLLLTDIFDSTGSFIATGRMAGLYRNFFQDDDRAAQEVSAPRFSSTMDKALFADLLATATGAVLGTSNVTTYLESTTGIAAGGRTGLTVIFTALFMLLCLPLSAIAAAIPAQATAPALIIVGVLMTGSFRKINWDHFEEAFPTFITVAAMSFAYSITTGMAFGFISYTLIMIFKGKTKQISPAVLAITALFAVNYVLRAHAEI
ncbi:MAG: NCS2 family permease [Clostridiales bacterium]|jgi:AGZA family xanthine/uracil permease-like MFS transporter|nr:NCS2 family permease [Clostridiales bacterium]